MTQHNHNVQHDGLHTVEPHKMVELLVLDDGQEENEEDDQRGKLGRKVHLCQRPRDQVQNQQITETTINLATERDRVDPRNKVAQRGEDAPHQGRRTLVCRRISSTRLKATDKRCGARGS